MKMVLPSRHMIDLLVLVLQCYCQVTCYRFNAIDNKLTAIPNTIPGRTTDLRLNHNYIRNASTIPPLRVRSLYITHNLLTEFPDLRNISSSIRTLILNQNFISVVSATRLSQLSLLLSLQLTNNLLANFPDAPGPKLHTLYLEANLLTNVPLLPIMGPSIRSLTLGETIHTLCVSSERLVHFPSLLSLHINGCGLLSFPEALSDPGICPLLRRLELQGNDIGSIPTEFLATKTKLRSLILSGTKLTTPPNICLANTAFRFNLYLDGSPIRCDRELWPLKLADYKRRVKIRGLVCDSPAEEAGKTWANANLDHPTADGSSQNFTEVTNFYCGGSSTVDYRLTYEQCAEKCTATTGCVGFGYSSEGWEQKNSQCGLIGKPNLSGKHDDFESWFMSGINNTTDLVTLG